MICLKLFIWWILLNVFHWFSGNIFQSVVSVGIFLKSVFLEGVNADSIKQAAEQLNSRWIEFCQLLSERLNWLEYQNRIITFYNQLQQLEQITTAAENWLKTQPITTSEPTAVKSQLKICKVRIFPLIGSMINRNFLEISKRIAYSLIRKFHF